MLGITSINPEDSNTPQSPEKANNPEYRDRASLAKEILADETVRRAVMLGIDWNIAAYREAAEEAKNMGQREFPEKTIERLQKLRSELDENNEQSLLKKRKQTESWRPDSKSRAVSKVILGDYVEDTGSPVDQLEIRTVMETEESRNRMLSENAYGKSPERLVVDEARSIAPIRFSISLIEARRPDHNGPIRITDTTGIALQLTRTGEIMDIQGFSSKHGVPTFTDGLVPDKDLADIRIPESAMQNINNFNS